MPAIMRRMTIIMGAADFDLAGRVAATGSGAGWGVWGAETGSASGTMGVV